MTNKIKFFSVALLALLTINAWGETLFHETFGNNKGSARTWNDSYSVKSGISAVYSGITGYTISNCKQGKNTTGSTDSGLNQTTINTDAYIIIGPLNVSSYRSLVLTYQWNAGSTKGTYTTKLYYKTSSGGDFTEVSGTGNGATTFVTRTYSLPQTAQVATLYLKIVWNTSNTGAIIDEVNLDGTASVPPTYSITYHCNGGSDCPSDVASGATALPNPLPSAPTKDGYTFGGWYTNEGCTEAAVAGATLSANANLYAKWTENAPSLMTVYLNLGSMTGWTNDNACFNVWDGIANRSLTPVTECGQAGIYSAEVATSALNNTIYFKRNDSGCNTKWNEASGTLTAVNNMMTLTGWDAGTMSAYAVPSFTVSCAANDGNYGHVSQASVTNVSCGTVISANGATLTVGSTNVTATPESATAQYTYAFSAWSWSPVGSEVNAVTTATATFTRTTNQYTINALSLTGCTITGTAWPSGKKDYGSSFSTTLTASEGYNLPNSITVTGATYTWDAETGALAITSVTGDVSVTVTATLKQYTVHFYNNGSEVKTVANVNHGTLFSTIKPTIGSGVGELNISSCDGTSTTFMGWTTDAAFQKRNSAPSFVADDATITNETTLRAVWAKEE